MIDLIRLGFAGIQNFPTVGLIDGTFRTNLVETGTSHAQEVDVVRLASQKVIFTTPYVLSQADATATAEAGAENIACHMGLTTGGSIGAETFVTLDDRITKIDARSGSALAVNPEAIFLCHGGASPCPRTPNASSNAHGF